jgi:hypothetical protein
MCEQVAAPPSHAVPAGSAFESGYPKIVPSRPGSAGRVIPLARTVSHRETTIWLNLAAALFQILKHEPPPPPSTFL